MTRALRARLGSQSVVDRLRDQSTHSVIVIDDVARAVPLARALEEGGLPCAEITFRTPRSRGAREDLDRVCPNVLVGAGTVLTPEQAADASSAGAKFVVAPGFSAAMVDYCVENEIPVFPGIATPTELEFALSRGLSVVKFFPAESLGGIAYLKAMSAPYGEVEFLPSGGIGLSNMCAYLSSPRVVACGGSWMAPADWIAAGQFDRIRDEVRKSVDAAQAVSKETLMTRVVTFGEVMLRLKSPGFERLLQSPLLEATFGGAEANVAVSLAQFGLPVSFVTALPSNPLGESAISEIRKFGVDTSFIKRAGDRIGIYFLESGSNQRASKVTYDRAGSSIAAAKPGDFDWNAILEGASWFHISGVTPAISASAAALSSRP